MKNDKTITLSSRIDFREPGQPSPYRDRSDDEARMQQWRQMNSLLGNATNLSGNPHVNGHAAQQLPGQWASLLGLRP